MFDLEGEVVKVMETVAASFDRFDLVIETFKAAIVDRVIAMIEQAVSIMIEHLCEFHQRLNTALFRCLDPLGEKQRSLLAVLALSQTLQIILEHIYRIQVLVQRTKFLQATELL